MKHNRDYRTAKEYIGRCTKRRITVVFRQLFRFFRSVSALLQYFLTVLVDSPASPKNSSSRCATFSSLRVERYKLARSVFLSLDSSHCCSECTSLFSLRHIAKTGVLIPSTSWRRLFLPFPWFIPLSLLFPWFILVWFSQASHCVCS